MEKVSNKKSESFEREQFGNPHTNNEREGSLKQQSKFIGTQKIHQQGEMKGFEVPHCQLSFPHHQFSSQSKKIGSNSIRQLSNTLLKSDQQSEINDAQESEKYRIPYQLALIYLAWIFFGFSYIMRHFQNQKEGENLNELSKNVQLVGISLMSLGGVGLIFWKGYIVKNNIKLQSMTILKKACLMSQFILSQITMVESLALLEKLSDSWVLSATMIQMAYIQCISKASLLNYIYFGISIIYLILRFQTIVKWEWQSTIFSLLICAVIVFQQDLDQQQIKQQTPNIISLNQKSHHLNNLYYEILGMIPSGVVMLDKNMNMVFSNKTINNLFECKRQQLCKILLGLSTNQSNFCNNNNNGEQSQSNILGSIQQELSQHNASISQKKQKSPSPIQYNNIIIDSHNNQDEQKGFFQNDMIATPSQINSIQYNNNQQNNNNTFNLDSQLIQQQHNNLEITFEQFELEQQFPSQKQQKNSQKQNIQNTFHQQDLNKRKEIQLQNNNNSYISSINNLNEQNKKHSFDQSKSIYTPSFKLLKINMSNNGNEDHIESSKLNNNHHHLLTFSKINSKELISPNNIQNQEAQSFTASSNIILMENNNSHNTNQSNINNQNPLQGLENTNKGDQNCSYQQLQQQNVIQNNPTHFMLNASSLLDRNQSEQIPYSQYELISPNNNILHHNNNENIQFFYDQTKRNLILPSDTQRLSRLCNNESYNNSASNTIYINNIDHMLPSNNKLPTQLQNQTDNFQSQFNEVQKGKQQNWQHFLQEEEENESEFDYLSNIAYLKEQNNTRNGKYHNIFKRRLFNENQNTDIMQKDTKISDVITYLLNDDNSINKTHQQFNRSERQKFLHNSNGPSSNINTEGVNQVNQQQETAKSKQNEYSKQNTFFSQMNNNKNNNLGYMQIHEDMIKVQVKWKDQIFVLKFLLYEIEIGVNTFEDFILILVDPLWQDYYNKRLEEVDKYKMKMFASLSHELRTPLNCTISMLEGLESYITDPSLIDDYLYPALHSQKLLLNQINDILDFAQIDSGKFKYTFVDFDLEKLLEDCQTLIHMQANIKSINLTIEYDNRLCMSVKSDPNRIRQILLNFLSNALKFTPENGIIKIIAEPAYIAETGKLQRFIRLSVQDSGIGMKPETLQNIFNAFNKTEYEKEGMNSQGCGLGLAISQSISKGLCQQTQIQSNFCDFFPPSQSLGIQVESQVSVGSTFSFLIQDMLPKQLISPSNNMSNNQHSQSINVKQLDMINEEPGSYSSINRHLSIQQQMIQQQLQTEQLKLVQLSNDSCEIENDTFIEQQYKFPQDTIKPHLIFPSLKKQVEGEGTNEEIEQPPLKIPFHLEYNLRNNIISNAVSDPFFNNSTSLGQNTKSSISNLPSQKVLPHSNKGKEEMHSSNNDTSKGIQGLISQNSQGSQHKIYSMNSQQSHTSSSQTLHKQAHTQEQPNHRSSLQMSAFSLLPGGTSGPSNKLQASNSKLTSNNISRTMTSKSFSKMISAQGFNGYHSKINLTEELNSKILPALQYFIDNSTCEQKCSPILVVDDNQFNILAFSRVLSQFFQVTLDKAFDGKQAYNKICARYQEGPNRKCNKCKQYQLIFMDIEMPIMTGYEVIKEISIFFKKNLIKEDKLPHIIACTAHGDQEQVKCKIAGFDDYIQKPIMKADLQKLLCDWYYDSHYQLQNFTPKQQQSNKQINLNI